MPISLVQSLPKLLIKVLAVRLQSQIPHLIHNMQSGFIKGRAIAENFILASEMIQCARKSRKPMFVLKLDFQKAFDSVNWECLLNILEARGFDQRWIRWVRDILTSSSARVLINGQPGDVFFFRRGVRQGDAISPYLFDLMADVLQRMCCLAFSENSLLHPLDADSFFPTLQYANDTLILLKGEVSQARKIKQILQDFAGFTGLQINYHKSTFVPLNVDEQVAAEAAQILGCPISALPCTYLGLPLSMNKITIVDLMPVIQKVDKRLAGWMATYLSWGGRLIMINEVLSAIPTHFMACFIWPAKGIELLDKLRRLFLWEIKDGNSSGHCLVAWDQVIQSKESGGLGI